MKPTDEIKDEHRTIGRALASFRDTAAALQRGQAVPPELIRSELDFIVNFTYECHHRKEEEILFPVIEAQLLAKGKRPVSEFLAAHRQGRTMINKINEKIDLYSRTDGGVAKEIARLAHDYFDLMVDHMRKENKILVDLIETEVPADKKLEIAERFVVIEDQLGPNYHRNYERLANELKAEGKKLAA